MRGVEKSGKHRCLRLRNAGISHAHPLEPNRAISRDRRRDGRLALALVQGSGISTRILTAQHLPQSQSTIFRWGVALSERDLSRLARRSCAYCWDFS
jgi:hypothetical protein